MLWWNKSQHLEAQDEENKSYTYTSADKKFTREWHTKKERGVSGRAANQNILRGAERPKGRAKAAKTPVEGFELFITDKMMQDVFSNTNKNIGNFMARFHDVLKESSKYTYVKETDLIELKALIGLLYLRAALQLNIFKTREIFFPWEQSRNIWCNYELQSFCIPDSLLGIRRQRDSVATMEGRQICRNSWIFHENERKQWKMPQPIAVRKCRWDPLPLPWENWYETVQSLQALKIWAFVLKLVWCKCPVYVFHPTICWKAWSDWCQRLLCHRLRWIYQMVGEQLSNLSNSERAKHFPRSILHQRNPSRMVPWEKYHHRWYPKVRPKRYTKRDERGSWQGGEKHCYRTLTRRIKGRKIFLPLQPCTTKWSSAVMRERNLMRWLETRPKMESTL